jgi:hypothetical protein
MNMIDSAQTPRMSKSPIMITGEPRRPLPEGRGRKAGLKAGRDEGLELELALGLGLEEGCDLACLLRRLRFGASALVPEDSERRRRRERIVLLPSESWEKRRPLSKMETCSKLLSSGVDTAHTGISSGLMLNIYGFFMIHPLCSRGLRLVAPGKIPDSGPRHLVSQWGVVEGILSLV